MDEYVESDDEVSIPPLSIRAVKVMLVHNRTVVREGLRALLEQQPDLAVVAQAETLADAGAQLVEPTVIVTDIDLPDARDDVVISGLRDLFPKSSILALSLVHQPARVQSVLAAGANGYLLETAAIGDLLTGIRTVASGETYLQSSLGVELARWQRLRETGGLTPEEEHVLQLLALGNTNAEIARLCGVSLRTVETLRSRIHQKIGRLTRAGLVEFAREAGLLGLDPQ